MQRSIGVSGVFLLLDMAGDQRAFRAAIAAFHHRTSGKAQITNSWWLQQQEHRRPLWKNKITARTTGRRNALGGTTEGERLEERRCRRWLAVRRTETCAVGGWWLLIKNVPVEKQPACRVPESELSQAMGNIQCSVA